MANRVQRVGRYHAYRTIVCAVSPDRRTTLDAVASVAAPTRRAASGGQHVFTHELVRIEIGPGHVSHLDSIVDPLVIADVSTLVWAPPGHWEAVDALRDISQSVLLDSVDEPEVSVALQRAEHLLEDRYVVDLAWLRSTPWRERIATIFDPPSRRPLLRRYHLGDGAPPPDLRRRRPAALRLARHAPGVAKPRRSATTAAATPTAASAAWSLCTSRPCAQDVPGLAGIALGLQRRREPLARPRPRRTAWAQHRRVRDASASGHWWALRAARAASSARASASRCCASPPIRAALRAASAHALVSAPVV